jgi:WD40 repeat protein
MKSPFKFLDSYTKDDREIFFGREREIEELYHRVFESKIMLVYGVSGTGKSSLIHCGLANKFQDTDWLPIVIRRSGNIMESMATGIKAASITEQQNKFFTPDDFRKGVRSLYLDHYKPVFFIFDQFEELFIFGDKEERRSFIQIVKTITESELQCRMIFVMREEYMAWGTEFEKFIPTFFSNRVRIEKMSHRNALEAIKGPCNTFNISIEEGFAESLLEKLSPGSEDVELTYLQVFLDKIFRIANAENIPERESGQILFTIPFLNKTGNVTDILGSFLDDQIALMDNPDRALVVLKSFVSVKGTKQPLRPGEVKEYALTMGLKIDDLSLLDLIRTFVNLRVLCEKDQNGRYELRHDALASKIFEKFTLAEKELLEVRKFVENSYAIYEKRGILLNKQDLEYLAGFENILILSPTLTDYIKLSNEKILSQRKAIRRITRLSALILILILAIVARFYIVTMNEKSAEDLFSSALVQTIQDPVKGLFSEIDLWNSDSTTSQLHETILSDFQRIIMLQADTPGPILLLKEYLKPVELASPIVNAEISKGEKYIYGWMENKDVFVYDILFEHTYYIKCEGSLKQLEFSDEKSLLALIYEDNKVAVYNLSGEELFNFEITSNEITDEHLICFSPKNDYLLAAVNGCKAIIYDKSGKIVHELTGHSGDVNSVEISPDARFIVTGSDDHLAYIWNYNHDLEKFTIYDSLVGHTGKVWSCTFNKTGKYVLTASEDSTIKIWDLEGNQVNPEFKFIINNTHFRLNNKEQDEDRANKNYSNYYGKFCNASFSPGELEIIATGYSTVIDSAGNIAPKYYNVMFFDGTGGFPHAYDQSYFSSTAETEKRVSITLSNFKISPDEKIAAVVNDTIPEISLITGLGGKIRSFNGICPMFSSGGKYLYWVNKNRINKFPVQPSEIKQLIKKYNIAPSDVPIQVLIEI